jgi:hypothetical protein
MFDGERCSEIGSSVKSFFGRFDMIGRMPVAQFEIDL